MRRAMKSALEAPDNILRVVGIVSAVGGLVLIWLVRRYSMIRKSVKRFSEKIMLKQQPKAR
jgi:hypothetical protein